MTIMFCQKCRQVAECKVENPQPVHRSIYFEHPYINAYIRLRTCSHCNQKFKTYEIGEATFLAFRKIVEISKSQGDFIEKTWGETKDEFFALLHAAEDYDENIVAKLEKALQKEESLLSPNVIPFPLKNE